ncbi:MAG: hypothetical protein PHU72_02515 [Dethiosulfovibrio sp.]|nr:hypothetical protein [Dethiosulfovibrio sp.]
MRWFVLLLCLCSSTAFGWQDRYDSMVQRSLSRETDQAEADSLKAELLSEVSHVGELELWRSLWDGTPRERASRGLALMEALYPDGDPSRWEEIGGFLHPSLVPKSLMAVDAVFVSVKSLMDLDGGSSLAASILVSFGSSSRAKHLFLTSLPEDMSSVLASLVEMEHMTGFWEPSHIVGTLPLAAPVRGNISQSSAVSRGMQFLDGLGVPSSNGPYCWDRPSGRIYQVVDREDPLWIPRL